MRGFMLTQVEVVVTERVDVKYVQAFCLGHTENDLVKPVWKFQLTSEGP